MDPFASAAPRALLLESNEDEAVLFQRCFAEAARHWHVNREKDGAAAVRRMVSHGIPDLLVTRLELPQRTGFDVIEWVRSLKSPKPIPVLIYDRTISPDQRKQLLDLEVAEILDKHWPPEKFKTELRRIAYDVEKYLVAANNSAAKPARTARPNLTQSFAS